MEADTKKYNFIIGHRKISFINKKCAAEATHEKCITPIAATQSFLITQVCENRVCIFTESKKHTLVLLSKY